MNARRIFVACLVVPTLFCLAPSARSASGEAFPVKVEVDASTNPSSDLAVSRTSRTRAGDDASSLAAR